MVEKIKKSERLAYPDICKFIAIYIVTCSHCAQVVSGQTWNNFIGGTEIDMAFNMPLFMIISGWFIDIGKLREVNIVSYVIKKFKRLILPSLSWQIIYIFLFSAIVNDLLAVAWFYWYLSALFICLCMILLFAKLIKNDSLCIFLSIVITILFPFSSFVDVNFMLPFLWSGYVLKRLYIKDNAKFWVCIFAIAGVVLSLFWNEKYSVYLAPFKLLYINIDMVVAYLYRFAIGFCLSAVIIYLVKLYERHWTLCWMAKFGKYTLIIYTFSFIINNGILILLNYMDYHTNEFLIIDILALTMSVIVCVISILTYNIFIKNRLLKSLFLGE